MRCVRAAPVPALSASACSNSETRPPFRPACIQNRASGLGFHAHAKAVGSLAARFRGLVSSLHVKALGRAEKPGITARIVLLCQ